MHSRKKKLLMVTAMLIMLSAVITFGYILVKKPNRNQTKEPLMFADNLGDESPYAKQYKESGKEDPQEFDDGTTVSKEEDGRYLVEMKGNIYGENAAYLVYCDDNCMIEYIDAMVVFDTREDEMIYYAKLIKAADEVYGKGILTDEGTDSETVRYTLKDKDDGTENTLFMSPEKLENEDGKTYYYVNMNIAEGGGTYKEGGDE